MAKRAANKRKAHAFHRMGFVAIDRSVPAFAVRALRNHLNLRRTLSHSASCRNVRFGPGLLLVGVRFQSTPLAENV